MVESSKIAYVVFAFFAALFLGALKGFVIGPVASVILIIGNVTIILGLFPAHVVWTVSAVIKSNKFSTILKVFILFSLVPLFALWLGLGIFGSLLVGIGYGFFTPWVSTFEAFRHTDESKKLLHCVTDGTWGTIKGSCTVVRDFLDVCFVSYSCYLKEICEWNGGEIHTIRLLEIPACIIVAILGLLVEVLSFTLISVVKSPYMLFKGWQRLLHDLVSREGPFLETACVPIAGFVILLWPLFVEEAYC